MSRLLVQGQSVILDYIEIFYNQRLHDYLNQIRVMVFEVLIKY
jgi:hypothetical protein